MSEFEDRENELHEGVGELPTGIQTERNEFSQTDADAVPVNVGGIPPDIAQQNKIYADGQGRLGSPVIPASVTSVYDGRPINARDFKVTDIITLKGDGNPVPVAQTLQSNYTVPLGFVSVLRGFQFQPYMIPDAKIENTVNNDVFNWTEVTLLINGINQDGYSQLKFGSIMDDPQEIFIIASELQVITFQVKFLSNFIKAQGTVPVETTPVMMQMYGNNLLTRGLPTPFEIATQSKSGINKQD